MSLLNYLFGRKGKTDKTREIFEESKEVLEPPMDLFIDNEPPIIEQPKVELENKKSHGKISDFLTRNYHTMGIFDGFENHSGEGLENAKKKIRAEFQFIMDELIDEKLERKLQARTMLTNVLNVSPEATANLEILIEELNKAISKLEHQKELSSIDEGWVMNAIHSYQQGFVQGMNNWVLGEQLINSVKNI